MISYTPLRRTRLAGGTRREFHVREGPRLFLSLRDYGEGFYVAYTWRAVPGIVRHVGNLGRCVRTARARLSDRLRTYHYQEVAS